MAPNSKAETTKSNGSNYSNLPNPKTKSNNGALTNSPNNNDLFATELLEDFYNEKNIFITGGTGFVGKVLIEKLLFEFPRIGNIYIMLRPKSGQLTKQRLDELIQCKVFDRIRAKYPERLEKLLPIGGDIRFPALGINPLDLQTLIQNVSIVFHSAATIRFDEPLRYALTLNTLGTKRVVQLAKKLINLKSFIHVSTAYCTVDKKNIEEKVYYEPIAPDRILEMSDWLDDSSMDRLADKLYCGRPCSYHYTKSLAEHLLAEEVSNGYFQSPDSYFQSSSPNCLSSSSSSLLKLLNSNNNETSFNWRPFPAAIIRPSIITCSWNDPFPGWIDNYNGTTGFLVVSGKGVLRSMHVKKDYKCDLVPVDVVINACIVSAWYIAAIHYSKVEKFPKILTNDEMNCVHGKTSHQEDIFVVNCVSGTLNPITWSQMRDISMPLMFKYPSLEMFRVPSVRYHQSQLLNKVNVYLEHTIPAFVVDFLFKFMGLTPILDKVYQKVHRATKALEFFTTNEWTYCGANMLLLAAALHNTYQKHQCSEKCSHELISKDILKKFPLDLRQLNWSQYFRNYVLGIRRFLLKEDPSTIPHAQNQLIMLYSITLMVKIFAAGTVCYQILYPWSTMRKSFRLLLNNNEPLSKFDNSIRPSSTSNILSTIFDKILK